MIPELPDIGCGYWYVASPITRYPRGLSAAVRDASRAAAVLVAHGVPLYCPAAHSHALAKHGGLDPLDHGLWLPQCMPLLDAAGGLIVLTLDGWRDSYGMGVERKRFRATGRPIVEWDGPA